MAEHSEVEQGEMKGLEDIDLSLVGKHGPRSDPGGQYQRIDLI